MNQPANPNKALWEKGDFTRIAASMRESGEALVAKLGIGRGTDETATNPPGRCAAAAGREAPRGLQRAAARRRPDSAGARRSNRTRTCYLRPHHPARGNARRG